MPPYADTKEPLALKGEAVELLPAGVVREVLAVEQMGKVGPIDYGSATSGGDATESGSSIINLDDELEMDDGTLGQFWINPLSDVEIEIRQTGQQEQRMVNSNQVGSITPRTPAPMRQVFVHGDDDVHAIISNPKTWDMAKTLVYYTGYKFTLSADRPTGLSGEPAAIPVDSLKQNRGTLRSNRGGRR